jgi:hypothetical protein
VGRDQIICLGPLALPPLTLLRRAHTTSAWSRSRGGFAFARSWHSVTHSLRLSSSSAHSKQSSRSNGPEYTLTGLIGRSHKRMAAVRNVAGPASASVLHLARHFLLFSESSPACARQSSRLNRPVSTAEGVSVFRSPLRPVCKEAGLNDIAGRPTTVGFAWTLGCAAVRCEGVEGK